jgi:hypothetical protein
MSKYLSQASKKVRYQKARDYLMLKTQQSRLPRLDKAKYQRRAGLEGPFMTKAGQVVYYDKIKGQYYNPDNDMYLSYDDWKKISEDAPTTHTGTAIAGTGDDSSTVVVKKKKKQQDKLMRRLKIKEALDRAVPDLQYPEDEITKRKQQLIDMARNESIKGHKRYSHTVVDKNGIIVFKGPNYQAQKKLKDHPGGFVGNMAHQPDTTKAQWKDVGDKWNA